MEKTYSEKVGQGVLCMIIIILPFNLLIGQIFPQLVSFPLYLLDFLILVLGFFFFLEWKIKKKKFCAAEKWIASLLIVFFCFGVITIFLNKAVLLQFVENNSKEVVLHSMLKQIIGIDPTQSINKTMQVALSFLLFFGICISSLNKEFMLKMMCIPLTLILVVNIFLVVYQQDVRLDGGREGVVIHPYSITETGRAYFPFVNSLLLSMYLSLLFFVVLFLILDTVSVQDTQKKDNRGKKYFYSCLLFLIILILGFTKGRAALLAVFVLFSLLIFFFARQKRVSPFPRLLFSAVGVFLFISLVSSFFIFSFDTLFEKFSQNKFYLSEDKNIVQQATATAFEATEKQKTPTQNKPTIILREADVDRTNAGRISLHWPTAVALFRTEPLFGIGTGMFYYSVIHGKKELLCMQKELCPDIIQPSDVSSTAHSVYLQVLAENGAVGFIVFIILISLILLFGHKKMENGSKEMNFCSLFLFAAVLAFLFQGFFVSYFEYREISYLFWIFVGLLLKN